MSKTPSQITPTPYDPQQGPPIQPPPVPFPGTVSVGGIFGIPLYIHILSPLLVGAILLAVRATGGVHLIPVLIGVGVSLFFHELGHALVARWNGYTVRAIVLYPLRNHAVIEGAMSPRHEMRVAFGGPAVNLLLALLSWSYLAFSGNATVQPDLLKSIAGGDTVAYLLLINATMMIGNLIPALPFDGGACFRAYLMQTTSRSEATRRVAQTGIGFALAFLVVGILMKSPLVALFGLMIFTGTMREVRQEKNEAAFVGVLVQEAMQREFHTVSVADRVHDTEKRFKEHRQRFFPVVQGGQIVGTINYETVLQFSAKKQGAAYVREAMDDQIVSVQTTDSLTSVVTRLTQNGNRPLLVMDGEAVVGIFTENSAETFLRRLGT
ncbi:MAG: CBS domain-containing protein [Fibrella sp.]|nr:CBS domain-containing protein [Armatimonadota bacterium]